MRCLLKPVPQIGAMNAINQDVAGRLEEAARLLRDQGADRYRIAAYLCAVVPPLDGNARRPTASGPWARGSQQLPCVGETIARAIRELVTHGRLPMLDRLRGDADPTTILASVPGIGRVLANTLHEAAIVAPPRFFRTRRERIRQGTLATG